MPAVELLVSTPAVKACLKDKEKLAEVRRHMADGKKSLGTQTYEQHVAELVEAELITSDTAKAALAMTPSAPLAPKRAGKSASG